MLSKYILAAKTINSVYFRAVIKRLGGGGEARNDVINVTMKNKREKQTVPESFKGASFMSLK